MTNLIGKSLGRYHILEQLGEGGMAIVYKAYDTRLERDVAVKVIRTEKLTLETMGRTLKRFEREAKALAKLTHPNIVPITDYGEHEDKPYLVMPHLPGGTLKQLLKGKPMPWEDAVRLLIPIARALHYAHQQGIIHRDVKPSNILITQSGEPMLTDFGIAKILLADEETADLTGTGMGVGTPEYMSPEQFQGKGVDARTDIYSLGVVLYEMVTGRKPYQADTPAAVLIKQATDPLPRPKGFIHDLPDSVERILLKSLSKGVDDRYKSMSEFGVALDGLIKQSMPNNDVAPVSQSKSSTPQESPSPVKPSVPQSPSLWRHWAFVVIPILILGFSLLFGREFIKPPLESFEPAVEKSTNTPAVTVVPSRTPTSTSPKTASPNLALNKTATSNVSPCDPSESSRKAVNGSWSGGLSDKWCAYSTGTLWWQVDLASVYRINKIVIYHAGAGGETLDYNTHSFNIQVSVNGTQWETVANISDNKSSITTHAIAPVDARYVRLVILRGEQGGNPTARIYEVQVLEENTDITMQPTKTSILDIGTNMTREKDGMVMIYVPKGPFEMGHNNGESNQKPARNITLDAFWIDQTEVTNTMFSLCVQDGKCLPPRRSGSSTRGSYYNNSQYANYPVIYVSWEQANAYCAWADSITDSGKTRLPTEAQWEKAARGTDGRTYPWGNQPPNINLLNYNNNVGDTSPVGSYPAGASPYGALDMAGNVWEWVADWYDPIYYHNLQDNNPSGPATGQYKVLRGGAWDNFDVNIRSAFRNWDSPMNFDYNFANYGFRCVFNQ